MQYRFVILGKWESYPSYFLYGALQGVYLNNSLARSVSLEKNSMYDIWEQINFFKPHAILCHTIFDNKPHRDHLFYILKKCRNKGIKVFYHAGDARVEPRFANNISSIVDYALINHWPVMPAYNIWRVQCFHWPYMALNQDKIADKSPIYTCDLAFTGSLENNQHHAHRAKFIQQLKSQISIKTFPSPESGNTRFQTPELAASANGILGFQMGLNVSGYQDVRQYQYIGAGSVYFHDKHPAIDKVFEDGVHYISFERDNIGSFIDKFNTYKDNIKIRKEGFKYGQTYHSSKERIRQVINILEGKEYKIYYIR